MINPRERYSSIVLIDVMVNALVNEERIGRHELKERQKGLKGFEIEWNENEWYDMENEAS
jgi:hypothetical protein